MRGSGRIFMPGCLRLATGHLFPEGLTPGSFLGVYTVRTSILVDDIPQPFREPGRELLVVRLETGILNIAARQNRVLGGGVRWFQACARTRRFCVEAYPAERADARCCSLRPAVFCE